MKLPDSIAIEESHFFLDGGSTTLVAKGDGGEKLSIHLSQRMLPGSSMPGRLYVNDVLVEVRSDFESKMIRLLKNATIAASPEVPNSQPGNRIILGEDIKEVLETSPAENLSRFRNEFIEYLESEEYLHIAKNGISNDRVT